MNHYPRHVGDFAAATQGLSLMERGAYNALLDQYYAHERSLPLERKEVYRMAVCNSTAERKAVDYVLVRYFVLQEDGWHNKRADEEIVRFHEKSEKARQSINSRWQNERNTTVSDSPTTDVIRTYPERNTNQNQNQRTTTPKPPSASPPGFADFWAAYPVKRGKGDAEKLWTRMRPDASLQSRISQAIEAAKRSADWRRDAGKFIPYPATWLNRRGWEDDYGAVVSIEAAHADRLTRAIG